MKNKEGGYVRLEQLEYFSAIARYKSMNLASEKLHVSQQTLSMSIKKMEDELDVQLLVRSHLGVSLTAEGEEFLKIAETFMRNIVNFKGKYTKKKTNA